MAGVETVRRGQESTLAEQGKRVRISVIVPVLNEEESVCSTVRSLEPLQPDEIIIVDGGSLDRTREVCEHLGVTVVHSSRGRGRQMNQGARQATGEALLFLHADTRLPTSALDDIRVALREPGSVGGRFDLRLDSERWIFRIIGFLISLRSRLTGVATGDQAIFVRAEVFEAMGGFPEIPLMEDFAFCRDLRRKGKVACLRSQVVTSARRWQKEGIARTIVKMWALKLLFLAGVSPSVLKRFYAETR